MKILFRVLIASFVVGTGIHQTTAEELQFEKIDGVKPMNVVFILSDDHRYDVMSFLGHPWVETPALDAMAKEGVHFENAIVTTSLCSPSRASILTGQYMHNHGVVDNNVAARAGTIFFPQYLQAAGYHTGFFGKWHMGGQSDAPRPGFDRWVSFKGQGHYYPPRNQPKWSLNIDGKSVPQQGYITDELTNYAIDWLDSITQSSNKPFFLYLSHKGVHGMFYPAERHAGRYASKPLPTPKTMANTDENYKNKPMWLKNQRNSWHGVDFAYHQNTDIAEHYRLYCEALLSVDESIARVRAWLKGHQLEDNTLVMYMGDNGFQWGEHGLIDKRTAYEASIRVPFIGVSPKLWKPGITIEEVVANIDIGPTILEAAGIKTPQQMDGLSFLQLAAGTKPGNVWRGQILYEYYWEYNYPQTPTTFALRTDQFKFIQYHGIWDLDELYDLKNDPYEEHNLIFRPEHQQRISSMRAELYKILEKGNATQVPFSQKRGFGSSLRSKTGSAPGDFPIQWIREVGGESSFRPDPTESKAEKHAWFLRQSGSDFEGACCEYHMIQARITARQNEKLAKQATPEKATTTILKPPRRPPLPNY